MVQTGKTVVAVLVLLALMAPPAAAASMGSIGKELVNVRTGPGLKFPVAFQGELGYPLQLDKRQGQWLSVRDWQGRSGWAYRPLVSGIHTVITLVDKANIRKAPSLKSRVVGQAARGEIFKVVASRGHWVKIAYYLENETIGWIYQKLVWGVKPGRQAPRH